MKTTLNLHFYILLRHFAFFRSLRWRLCHLLLFSSHLLLLFFRLELRALLHLEVEHSPSDLNRFGIGHVMVALNLNESPVFWVFFIISELKLLIFQRNNCVHSRHWNLVNVNIACVGLILPSFVFILAPEFVKLSCIWRRGQNVDHSTTLLANYFKHQTASSFTQPVVHQVEISIRIADHEGQRGLAVFTNQFRSVHTNERARWFYFQPIQHSLLQTFEVNKAFLLLAITNMNQGVFGRVMIFWAIFTTLALFQLQFFLDFLLWKREI